MSNKSLCLDFEIESASLASGGAVASLKLIHVANSNLDWDNAEVQVESATADNEECVYIFTAILAHRPISNHNGRP